MKITKFEDLTIWKDSLALTKTIYDHTAGPKFSRDFALRDQIRRAVISISSNIVEGFEKNNNNEFCRFLRISKGSSGEVKNQLYIAKQVGYISNTELEELLLKLDKLAKQIGAFIIYLEKYKLTRNPKPVTK
jgi:four helix bundle protein